jgi:hypothetical protein
VSNEETKAQWSPAERELLGGLLNQIIPASEDGQIPSADSPEVVDYLERQLQKVSDLAELFEQGLSRAGELTGGKTIGDLAGEARIELVKKLEQQEPRFFEALLRYTYMGYYTNPAVPPLFGLSPKPPQPDGYEVPDEDLEKLAALVEPVKSRGNCYREA